jgi:fused signal recognition particle receptor
MNPTRKVTGWLHQLSVRAHKNVVRTLSRAASGPTVLLVAGVNGSGKTTSIAKLAKRLKDRGHKIVLSASDTFRAAAVEQLEIWARRIGVDIVKQQTGADPAAVAFDATERAIARNADFLIVDTAGRLHTNKGLMEELKKIVRVIQRKIPDAPHETLLVLDATTGQNAIRQAKEFSATVPVTGLLLAKLDGTAKGGAVFGIRAELPCPVKFIGVGEGIDDLLDFEPEAFVDAVLQMEPQADEAVGR